MLRSNTKTLLYSLGKRDIMEGPAFQIAKTQVILEASSNIELHTKEAGTYEV